MTNLFNKLYYQFLNGKVNRKNFLELKESLKQLSDKKLSESMESYWLENNNFPKMETNRKLLIQQKLYNKIHSHKTFFIRSRFFAVASIIAILSIITLNIYILNKQQGQEMSFCAKVPAGDKVILTLPDKTSVKLNSESSLSYSYEKGKRIVTLEGEGFFQVFKDKKHPFIVRTGTLSIEVLGTCFNVYSYNNNDYIETSLLEGSIRLYETNIPSEFFELKPSQKAIYNKNSRNFKISNTNNSKETAWIQDNLVFESEKLSVVLAKIERWYGVHIYLLYPEIANDLISGSFKDEQLQYVMEAIKLEYGVNYKIIGNTVTINKSNNLKSKK